MARKLFVFFLCLLVLGLTVLFVMLIILSSYSSVAPKVAWPKQIFEPHSIPVNCKYVEEHVEDVGDCGVSSISVPGLIGRRKREIGGEDADVAEYPWQAFILLNNKPSCGGSIINRNWVLTAAHCFCLDSMKLEFGFEDFTSYYISDINATYNKQDIKQNLFIHSKYNPHANGHNNDIALIRLKQELIWTPYVKPICLATPEDIRPGQKAISTGWGMKDQYVGFSFSLQEVVLDVISLTHCRSLSAGISTITDNMICTYTEGKDACNGDSGGPLITKLDNGRWAQIGIVSFGSGCAKKDSPGVFTNVPNYRAWIDHVTGSDRLWLQEIFSWFKGLARYLYCWPAKN